MPYVKHRLRLAACPMQGYHGKRKTINLYEGIVPQMILPLLTTLIVGLLMEFAIGIPILWLTEGVFALLTSMQNSGGSIILLGFVVGILSAIDYGGPIAKVTFVFVLQLMTQGIGAPISALISASMIAPFGLTLGYFLSRPLKNDIFSEQEINALKSAFLMGCCEITEGSYPIILNDLIRITICTAIGAAVDGALVMYFQCASTVPAGGFFALPGIANPHLWLLSLFTGSLVFAICLQFLKHKVRHDAEPREEEDQELDLSKIKISG